MKKIVAIILCIAMKVTLVSYNKISGEDISGKLNGNRKFF